MRALILIALRSLARHRRRTLLLGGAIAAVTALVGLMQGLRAGVRETMIRSATTLMTGHVNVGGFYKVSAGQGAPLVVGPERVLAIVRREVPGLESVVARGRGYGKLVSETDAMQASFAGIDVEAEDLLRRTLAIAAGRFEDLAQPDTLLVFEAHARRLGVRVGDVVTLSSSAARGITNSLDVRVVAVARDLGLMSQYEVFVSQRTLCRLYQLNPDSTGALMLYLEDLDDASRVATRLRSALGREGYRVMDPDRSAFWKKFQTVNREAWIGQKLDVTTWDDEIVVLTRILTALDALTAGLLAVLLSLIVAGIMNTLWIAIRERTREIGTLRAIGMGRGRVMGMFVFEALLLGLGSTACGGVIWLLVAEGLNAARIGLPFAAQAILMSDTLTFSLEPRSLLWAMAIIAGVTALAAVFPAYRATRLRPISAMHHAG